MGRDRDQGRRGQGDGGNREAEPFGGEGLFQFPCAGPSAGVQDGPRGRIGVCAESRRQDLRRAGQALGRIGAPNESLRSGCV